jgi:hypothetical protein
MAYFNHAFSKTFLAAGPDANGVTINLLNGSTTTADTANGFVTTAGLPTYALNEIAASEGSGYNNGYIAFFDPKTNVSTNGLASLSDCCPLYLAGSTIYASDKIGPFHGGYQETNKSKIINPRYTSRFYVATPCEPQNEVLHVGSTFWTAGGGVLATAVVGANDGATYVVGEIITATTTTGAGTGIVVQVATIGGGGAVATVTIINPGKGYSDGSGIPPADVITLTGGGDGLAEIVVTSVTDANTDPITGSGGVSCCKEFLCGETYHLRVDIKGSPALRYLNHNAYYTAEAYTGCCPDQPDNPLIAPVPVDSTEVMILWADALLRYPVVNPFLQIIIQDETGVLWYAPGTPAAQVAALGGDTWNNYVSTGHIDGACAGMIINGAYVDTKFGDCTFQLTDFYEKEPVKLYASEVDLNGDPCLFTGICVVHECLGTQANGLGETILRDLTLSENYRQNFLHSDLRIREITQGNQIISAVNRNGLYYQYMLQHSVPRHNNPSGTFDADQYMLQIVSILPLATFEEFVVSWLENCGVCDFDTFGCETECAVPITFPSSPPRQI